MRVTTELEKKFWNDKVVWLTGASSGIGKELAVQLAKAGARVGLTARRKSELEAIATVFPAGQVAILPGDVSERHQMIALGRGLTERWGRVDVLIANAGVMSDTLVEQFEARHVERAFAVNFFGAVYAIEAVLPYMQLQRSGQIVGVSSVAAFRGLPNLAAYGASKAALSHLLESLRIDLANSGIEVTVVHPGFVHTEMIEKSSLSPVFAISVSDAARTILYGILQQQYEIHFPWRFTLFMKALSLLPINLYYEVMKRFGSR